MNHLCLQNMVVDFGEVKALNNVSIQLSSGEILMIVGPNGAGKSTLLKVLLGLVTPQKGFIQMDGKPLKEHRKLKEILGYLPEAVAFSENLTATQVLQFFAQARNVRKERIQEVLQIVELEHAAKRKVRGYSRGMRQRLGLAVSILTEPPLLILDEPTGGLDQMGLSVLWKIFKEWREKKRMIIVSSHDLALLERKVDQVCVLRKGKCVAKGHPSLLRQQTSILHRVQMLFSKEFTAEVFEYKKELQSNFFEITEDDEWNWTLSIPGENLLQALELPGKYPNALSHIRVEEPSFDEVYERLLEQEE